jgi:hypothetical protein
MSWRIKVIIIGVFAASPAQASPPRSLSVAVAEGRSDSPSPHFKFALVDLNDDGVPDAVALVDDPEYCGSGGCNLLVFRGIHDGSFQRLTVATINREPITVLREKSHGWHSLTVAVGWGGAKSCYALMRFNGQRYPANPSTAPCAMPRQLHSAKALSFSW